MTCCKQRLGWMIALAVFVICALPADAALPPPPATPVQAVTETHFGTSVVDPYRWLENLRDPAVAAWLKAQNDYTRAVLAKIPGRAALLARIKTLDNAGTSVSAVQVWGRRYFYYKTAPGFDNRRLYVRDRLTGPERLLVDPEKLTTPGRHYSIDYFTPSRDGGYVAYGISPSGSEASTLHVIESASGRILSEHIDRTDFDGIAWRGDGRSFYYHRLAQLRPGQPPTEKYRKSRSYLHVLGRDPAKDPPVFGYGLSSRVEVGVDDEPFVVVSPVSSYALGYLAHGVQNEVTLYAAPASAVRGAATPWRKIVDVADDVTNMDIHGDDLYLLTHKDASRYKIVKISLARPDAGHAALTVPESSAVITSLSVAQDALYVQLLDGGIGRLERVPFDGSAMQEIALPFQGAIQFLVTNPQQPGALVRLAAWTKSPLWYAYDPPTAKLTDTHLMLPSPVDFSRITSVEVKAASADGTLVPLSIIYPLGMVLDGGHPAVLEGYGAYGITIDPSFSPTRLAWLERGGVLAACHARGGGEYGEDWHLAGKMQTKQHTIDDFIACARYLTDHKYTSAAKLAGEGGSAGGITIGGAITQRPDLFGAALDRVGESNPVRIGASANGPPNFPEFGDPGTPEGFKALLGMDAYQHVKDGTAYPAVMLTTGINDPRVDSWEAAKMTARLQAATSSGKPVLLRVDYEAGHGIGSTKSQRDAELADEYSFLLWQFGLPDFQPAGP